MGSRSVYQPIAVVGAWYRRLPEALRWGLRPLNLADELASFLPGSARVRVVTATELMRRALGLRRARYRLCRLEGETAGGHGLVCLLAMDAHSARYWSRHLFVAPPAEQVLASLPALAVPRVCAERAHEADLSLWQTSWPVSRLVRSAPRVPSWVSLDLALGGSLEGVIEGRRSGRKARRNEARRVRRLGFTPRTATSSRDWEAFRRDLYEPFAESRFGDLAVTMPRESFRHARRGSELLLLEREGRTLAGALIEAWDGHARLRICGVDLGGEVEPEVLLQACYYHALGHAAARGISQVGLGACRPVLTDGVLRYKRKWGGTLGALETRDAFILRYRHTPAVRSALTAAPLIVEYPRGTLVALVGAAGVAPDALEAHAQALALPGLAAIACLVDRTPDGHRAGGLIRIVPPGTTWPREAEVVP